MGLRSLYNLGVRLRIVPSLSFKDHMQDLLTHHFKKNLGLDKLIEDFHEKKRQDARELARA